MGKTYKSTKEYIFITLLGAISGSFIGQFLGNTFTSLEFLGKTYAIGFQNPLIMDLKVIQLTFGFNFSINIMSIIGIILAIVIYKKF